MTYRPPDPRAVLGEPDVVLRFTPREEDQAIGIPLIEGKDLARAVDFATYSRELAPWTKWAEHASKLIQQRMKATGAPAGWEDLLNACMVIGRRLQLDRILAARKNGTEELIIAEDYTYANWPVVADLLAVGGIPSDVKDWQALDPDGVGKDWDGDNHFHAPERGGGG